MDKAPQITQNYRYNGGWRTLSLSEQDMAKLMALHEKHTLDVMKRCVEDALDGLPPCIDLTEAACSLFEARAEKLFTWIQRALKEKTQVARANGGYVVEEESIELSSSDYKEKLFRAFLFKPHQRGE